VDSEPPERFSRYVVSKDQNEGQLLKIAEIAKEIQELASPASSIVILGNPGNLGTSLKASAEMQLDRAFVRPLGSGQSADCKTRLRR
jgi:hypothetical protein